MHVVKIKKLQTTEEGRKVWTGVPIEKLRHGTLLDYIQQETEPVVAALFEDETELKAVITNNEEYIEMYKDKCLVLMADQLSTLMLPDGSSIELVARVFPDGQVREVSTQ